MGGGGSPGDGNGDGDEADAPEGAGAGSKRIVNEFELKLEAHGPKGSTAGIWASLLHVRSLVRHARNVRAQAGARGGRPGETRPREGGSSAGGPTRVVAAAGGPRRALHHLGGRRRV